MSKYSNRDSYLTAAGVLKNRLGVALASDLEEAEAAFASIRSYELAQSPLPGNFDWAHLKAIHRYLFQDVYEWAGECRTIDISKGENFFAHHNHIETAAQPIWERLAKQNYFVGLTEAEFSEHAAQVLGRNQRLASFP